MKKQKQDEFFTNEQADLLFNLLIEKAKSTTNQDEIVLIFNTGLKIYNNCESTNWIYEDMCELETICKR